MEKVRQRLLRATAPPLESAGVPYAWSAAMPSPLGFRESTNPPLVDARLDILVRREGF